MMTTFEVYWSINKSHQKAIKEEEKRCATKNLTNVVGNNRMKIVDYEKFTNQKKYLTF